MSTDTTLVRVTRIIVEQLGVDESEVKLDADVREDLGTDSLDTVELVMAIETEFNVDISDEDAEKWKTVGDVVKYLDELPLPDAL